MMSFPVSISTNSEVLRAVTQSTEAIRALAVTVDRIAQNPPIIHTATDTDWIALLFTTAVQIILTTAGFVVAVYVLKRQMQSDADSRRKQQVEDLRLKLYERLIPSIDECRGILAETLEYVSNLKRVPGKEIVHIDGDVIDELKAFQQKPSPAFFRLHESFQNYEPLLDSRVTNQLLSGAIGPLPVLQELIELLYECLLRDTPSVNDNDREKMNALVDSFCFKTAEVIQWLNLTKRHLQKSLIGFLLD